jgi:muramidase (phage lysozyme)
MADLAFYDKFRNTPAGRGLLQAIRFAEGTAGPKGYQTMFGGGTFSDLTRHPDRVIRSGGYNSAAAGAYQFLPGTWQATAKRLGLPSFEPKYQDIAALDLARRRLMSLGGLSTVEKEGLTPRVAAALAPEWASFPTMQGTSYYGQPVKKIDVLQQQFAKGKGAAPQTPAPTQQTASQDSAGNFLQKFLMNTLLFGQQSEAPSLGEQLLTSYMKQPLTEESKDLLSAGALTPRSPFLNQLTGGLI